MNEKFSLTISKHDWNLDSHLDIFIDQEEYLETYSCDSKLFDLFVLGEILIVTKKNPHRKIYLDYTGKISGDRGKIEVMWKGFCIIENFNFLEKMYMQKIEDTLIRFY